MTIPSTNIGVAATNVPARPLRREGIRCMKLSRGLRSYPGIGTVQLQDFQLPSLSRSLSSTGLGRRTRLVQSPSRRRVLNSYARCFLDGAKPGWSGWRWCSRKQRRSNEGATSQPSKSCPANTHQVFYCLSFIKEVLESRLLENPGERVRTGGGSICIHCISVWPAGTMKTGKLSKQYVGPQEVLYEGANMLVRKTESNKQNVQ